ncbi:10588_t:CDS:2 [Paraglomus brasilianum]|uniref:10588_t:CDS:1 n=1 Tax=Paraglomus brasilianum TaxID=144538 RepID=A0A9N8ZRT2_9GLOM|nr:10588_t:CDS:2 [Paraglomus brasilianum]
MASQVGCSVIPNRISGAKVEPSVPMLYRIADLYGIYSAASNFRISTLVIGVGTTINAWRESVDVAGTSAILSATECPALNWSSPIPPIEGVMLLLVRVAGRRYVLYLRLRQNQIPKTNNTIAAAPDTLEADNAQSKLTLEANPLNVTIKMSAAPSEKAQAFMQKLVQTLNHGALCLMISIGYRTGLFDTLAGFYPEFVTSQALASKANLNERYVREWLGAVVIGEIVEYNSEAKTYRLPKEHAPYLTRAFGAENYSIYSQYIPILGSVEDGIIQCFKNGGGLREEAFTRFHELMVDETHLAVGSVLHSVVLPGLPQLHDKLKSGSKLVDVGCGRGKIILDLAKTFPNSTFVGYDISEHLIAAANADVASSGLTNISFRVQDIAQLQEVGEYDVVLTIHTIHDLADPAGALKRIHGALKADGVFVMQDASFSHELEKNKNQIFGVGVYAVSTIHCTSVSLAEGGPGLGMTWGTENVVKLLKETGFSKTEDIIELPHDPSRVWYVSWK